MSNSIKSKPQSELSIKPNPSNGVFTITSQSAILSVQVHDMLGNIIYNQTISNSALNMNIDLSNQPKGIYFIKVKTNEEFYNDKVVIQ